jgi:ribosome-associated protein
MKNGLEFDLKKYINAIYGKKIIELVAFDVRGLTSIADAFLICSGQSHRHVSAIAEHIRLELKKEGINPLSVEGKRRGHWVILDYNHVVIHVFYEPVRAVYDLEGFWADAPRIETEDMIKRGKGNV